MISDHVSATKTRIKIMTVDPTKRRVEGVMKDGSMIQIAVWDVPHAFRWPKEGEVWLVQKHGTIWMLCNRQQEEKDETTKPITKMNPGEMVLDSEAITDAKGNYLDKAPQIIDAGNLGTAYTLALSSEPVLGTPGGRLWLVGTLTDNCTITITNRTAGCQVLLLLRQDSIGGHGLSVSDGVSSSALGISTSPSAIDIAEIYCPNPSDLYILVS